MAIIHPETDVAGTFLAAGADTSLVEEGGNSSLHLEDVISLFKKMLSPGGNVNVQNKNGWSPLHSAVLQDRKNIAAFTD